MAARLVSLVLCCACCGCHGHHRHAEHDAHAHEAGRPPALGADPRGSWLAPVDPDHESRRGTPYVHAFHAEPAFLGRDVLVHVEKEGDEHGLEVELEYALTRRLLAIGEVPYVWTDEASGPADVEAGLRALLVETDRLLLSAQVGFSFPTAREGLGADEVAVSPSALAWADLGGRFTAQGNFTLDHGTESGTVELSWGGALGRSFELRPLLGGGGPAHGGHAHGSWATAFLEGRGTYSLSGEEAGTSSHELLLGVVLPLVEGLDLRAGWTLRWEEEAAEAGWILGAVLHL